MRRNEGEGALAHRAISQETVIPEASASGATPRRDGGAVMSRVDAAAITNAMTVDVEDYFQVSAFADTVDRTGWDQYPCRIERNIETILELFAERNVHATFFTLGWVAEHYPSVIRRIVDAGHELASHGFEHVRVHEQAPGEFRDDVRDTKHLLEDLSGAAVNGYRAASFSIGEQTPWAFEVLAEEGYAYSSSIYPIRHDLYGSPDAPRFAYQPAHGHGLIEIPVSTVTVFGHNMPCGGGGYFRLLPYAVSRWAMRRVNRRDGRPCVFYFHPWEVDPGQPRFQGIPLKARIRHYTNLGRMEQRLRAVLADFAWDRMDRVFLAHPTQTS